MKTALLWLLLFMLCTSTRGQSINYESNLLTALSKAKQSNKIIFINIAPPSFVELQKRLDMPNLKPGLEVPAVVKLYNKRFINLKINLADSAYNAFKKQYPVRIDSYPAYLFLDSQGEIFYKGISVSSTSPKQYTDMANGALTAASSGKTISNFKTLKAQGKLTQAQLKECINLRESLGMYDNYLLADEYVKNLTIKSFDDYQEVLFLWKTGPLAFGKTYNLIYTNRKIIDSIFKTEPLQLCKDINNRIIVNTRNEAIRTKDLNMARQLSNFVQGSWSKESMTQGIKASNEEMLIYYTAVKDTANYYRQAGYFYDNYYMRLSVDSIKKLKDKALEANRQASMTRMKQLNPGLNTNNVQSTSSNGIISTSGIIVSTGGPSQNDASSVLNNAAYTFYTMGTRDPNNLTKALLWCKRAIALSPNVHAYYDTMAHLLYRLNFYDEALLNQNKAIEIAKKETYIQPSYLQLLQKELANMQQHTL